MSATPYDSLSKDAQTAQIEFASDFEQALAGASDPWAMELGRSRRTRALKTKFPVPVTAVGFEEFRGDPRYRTLSSRTIEATIKEYFDGVSEKRTTVEAPDFMAWDDEPANMAAEAAALPNSLVGDLLVAATGGTHPWDDLSFFNDAHLVNPFKPSAGTFDNQFTGQAISLATLKLIKARFRGIKKANGKRPLGLRLTHILVHPDQEQDWRDFEQNQRVGASGGEENRHRATFEVIVGDDLPSTLSGIYFPLALNKVGMYPWAVQQWPSPEVRFLGLDSAMYEKQLNIGVDVILRATAALGMPHCIQRCAIA